MSHVLKKISRRSIRLFDQGGWTTVRRIGDGPIRRDVYHWLLNTPIYNFIVALIGGYLGLNVIFALGYLACGDAIANARPGSFEDAFFFSVQTMATIGYGRMEPIGLAANLLVTFEAGIGLFGVAVASGLMFARFTRPNAGVRFSAKITVSEFDGRPMLMLRLANRRDDGIHEARVHLTLLRDEVTREGIEIRRLHDLHLERSNSPTFALSWTVMHEIGPKSPLYGKTHDDLVAEDALIVVVFAGHHSGFSQEVHARAAFGPDAIAWNARYVDVFVEQPDGRWALDFSRFDDVVPVPGIEPAIPVERDESIDAK
ncbi:MAG TPA: ion channel [Magnetospirillaceae bacterium]|jgi:inward rectifier potassium channel